DQLRADLHQLLAGRLQLDLYQQPLSDRRRRFLGARVLVARALLITNPAAARTAPFGVTVLREALKSAGWTTEVLAAGGAGDARRLAEYGRDHSVDLVAVFGGDGTTMQAAAALVGTEIALGVIRGGTGNLLAGNLRIPASPARAAEILLRGRTRRLDLGRMDRPSEGHYFAGACGAAVDSRGMGGGVGGGGGWGGDGGDSLGAQAELGHGGVRRHHAPPDHRGA